MITRIELKNFMSHRHTVIEPAAGLTVLVGPNNIGKSAVVAALQILCHNENSTYVLRHDQRECMVEVQTSDGHVVQWRRKTSPSYRIDGTRFDRLRGSGLPDELHKALRLPRVEGGNDADFDVHFGSQKSPIFLLGSSESARAQFFASSTDVNHLVAMQRRHKEKRTEAAREKDRLEVESQRVNGELETLEPAIEIEQRIKSTERDYDELVRSAQRIDVTGKHLARLRQRLAEQARWATLAHVLDPLESPPILVDVRTPTKLIEQIHLETIRRMNSETTMATLTPLPVPPLLTSTVSFATTIARLGTAKAEYHVADARACSLAALDEPPFVETSALTRLTERMSAATDEHALAEAQTRSLHSLSVPPPQAEPKPLQTLTTALAKATADVGRARDRISILDNLPAAPEDQDTAALGNLIGRLDTARDQVRQFDDRLTNVLADVTRVADQLRRQAEQAECPTCGGPLNPERLLAKAVEFGGDNNE